MLAGLTFASASMPLSSGLEFAVVAGRREIPVPMPSALFHSVRKDRPAVHCLRLTVSGSYRLAVKRNVGHAGQTALAAMADVEVGRWAVTRAEHLLSSYFLCSARKWYSDLYAKLDFRRRRVTAPLEKPTALGLGPS